MKKGILITTLCCFSLLLFSQNSLKQKFADSYFESLAYVKALKYYEEIASHEKQTNNHAVRRTAECYNLINEFDKSVYWYKVLYERGEATLIDKYNYMLLLRKIKNYDESIKILKDYYETGGDDRFVKQIIQNPDILTDLIYKPSTYSLFIVKNEKNINSKENDFCPSFYKDGIFFASARKFSSNAPSFETRKFQWDETAYLDLYYAKGDYASSLSDAKRIKVEGSEKFHDGPAVVDPTSPDIIYLTRSHYLDGSKGKIKKASDGTLHVNLYIVKHNDKELFSPVAFPTTSSEFSTGNATVSADGNYMVFSSDRPQTMGESDLWMVQKQGDSWGTPVHLGDNINTKGRENFPFLSKNGDLYFSSNRLPGLGGFDVFCVNEFLYGGTEVKNLGKPINSSDDDIGFIINEQGYGYFSSNREGGVGKDDIYSFWKKAGVLNVQVIDKDTRQEIKDAKVSINLPIGDTIKNLKTGENGWTGFQYLTPLEYTVTASKDTYIENKDIKRIILKNNITEKVVIELSKLSKLSKFDALLDSEETCPKAVLEDIYYDFDKYFIRNDAGQPLDELLDFLIENPTIKILLVSHTDSRGSYEYNNWLSQKRAEACVNYLTDRGINPNRLIAQGRGESQLLNQCSNGIPCSELQHQANRRTEVILISEDCYEVDKVPNKYLR